MEVTLIVGEMFCLNHVLQEVVQGLWRRMLCNGMSWKIHLKDPGILFGQETEDMSLENLFSREVGLVL